MRAALLLLLACAGCGDAATNCPAAPPGAGVACNTTKLTCDYGATICACTSLTSSDVLQFNCLPSGCYAPDGQCTPGQVGCTFGFEDTRFCDAQRHWYSCGGGCDLSVVVDAGAAD
jgi:hypothetical protein